jgi:hypothetical protein
LYVIEGQNNLCFFFPTVTGIRTDGKRLRYVEANRKATCVCVCVCVCCASLSKAVYVYSCQN